MSIEFSEILETLRGSSRCRPEAKNLSERFSSFTIPQIESVMRECIAAGESVALGNLLIVCGINKVKLNPRILVEALRVIDDIRDFIFAFAMQDGRAIDPLLRISGSEDLSWERQALAVRLAAELAVRFDSHQDDVKKCLIKLDHEISSFEANLMLDTALSLLEGEKIEGESPWFTQRDPLEELSEEKPPIQIGGDYTVRRPVPKLSRNAPCHCGSGKKYKRCCYEKDQKLLRDASEYEGITRTQVLERPSLVQDTAIIERMRAFELKKLPIADLNPEQLYVAYRRCELFGLREMAFDILLQLEQKAGERMDVHGFMTDLLYFTLQSGELELARKIRAQLPPEKLPLPPSFQFQFHLLENPGYYQELEKYCTQAFQEKEEMDYHYPLLELCYSFEKFYPALCVVFGRAAILANPERRLDNEMLLESIRNARIDLGMDPWDDPIEGYFDQIVQDEEKRREESELGDLVQKWREQSEEAQQVAAKKARELKKKELELEELLKKFEKLAKESSDQHSTAQQRSPEQQEMKETITDLRRQVKNLKVEIDNQRQERLQLRKQLEEERRKTRPEPRVQPATGPISESSSEEEPEYFPAKVLIPEYSEQFRRSCETLSTRVVVKAIQASAGFAVRDQAVWRQSKSLEQLPDHYRTRIGLHYRLMLFWPGGPRLQVLDLIPRSNLTHWIKNRQMAIRE